MQTILLNTYKIYKDKLETHLKTHFKKHHITFFNTFKNKTYIYIKTNPPIGLAFISFK